MRRKTYILPGHMRRVKRQRLKRRLRLYALRIILIPFALSQLSILLIFMPPAEAEAASLTVASAVSEVAESTTSTSYVASNTSIASGSLPAGTYFVAWGASVAANSSANVSNVRLTRGSTAIAEQKAEASISASAANQGIARSGYWLGELNGSEALTIEYSVSSATAHIDSKFIKAIRLDDKLLADTDYFTSGSQESASDEVANASTSSWTDVKTLTKTFGGTSQDYLLFASMEISPDSTSNDCSGRVEIDGTASMTSILEGEDTADQHGYALAKKVTIGSGSKSIKLQGQSVGTATCDFLRSRIYAFRASIFDQTVENYSSGESTLASATWTDKNSQSYTPAQSETVVVIGSRIQGSGSAACPIATRIDDGTSQFVDTHSFVPNNATPDYYIGMSAMSGTYASTTTFKIQFQRVLSTCSVKVKESTLIIWSMTLEPAVAKQSAYRWFSNTASDSQAWWNTSWANRRKITLNNSASGENLSNFPIRVSLVGGTNIDYSKTKDAGEDIRFVDADDSTELKYEIEKWDESGTSEAWVKVPQIDNGSTADFVWMYYNNPSATDAQDEASVWDSDYNQVYHLKGTSGSTTIPDVTSPAQNGTKLSSTEPANATSGKISEAQNFDGTNDNIEVASPGLPTGDFTYEVWINPDVVSDKQIFMASQGTGGNEIGAWIDTAAKIRVFLDNTAATLTTATALSTGQWTHVVVTRLGSSVSVYFNGVQDANTGTNSATLDFSSCQLLIGYDADGGPCNGSAAQFFDGHMDEFRISNIGRSAEWIEATHITTNNAMNTFGGEDSVWWDNSWGARRKVTFDNSASAENLSNFPVRVSLVGSGAGQNIDYNKTQNAGQDIRFIDEDGTVLKYEIEKWDENDTSEVWVKVPQISSGATNDYIWMYYGNASASDGQDATNVWNSGYMGVWHLKDGTTLSAADSKNAFNGTNSNATATSGYIDGSGNFNGTNARISIPDFAHTGSFTMSWWAFMTGAPGSGEWDGMFMSRGGHHGCTIEEPTADVWCYSEGTTNATWDTGYSLPTNQWVHLTYAYNGSNKFLYVNGGQSTFSIAATGTLLDDSAAPYYIGQWDYSTNYFTGKLDEVRFSNMGRSADWVEASYKTQNNQMNSYTAQELNVDFTPLATTGTAATLTSDGQAFRLRLLLNVSTNFLYAGDISYKLQYAQKSGTCDAAYSGESYGDVATSSGDIRYNDNTGETDGSAMNSDPDDPTNGSNPISVQTYEEANNFTNTSRINAGADGKWEFALVDSSAGPGASYCFRVVQSDGTPIATPDVVPEITTHNAAPSMPTSPSQKKTDDTVIATAGWTNETSIKVTATVTDTDDGDTVRICVEVDTINTQFASSGDGDGCSSAPVNSGQTANVTISGLSADTQYHWQVRAKDSVGAYSSWVSYPTGTTNNDCTSPCTSPPADRDFGIDASAPTGGTVYDGTETGVDKTFSDTSLSALSANWAGFNFDVSLIQKYEYSIGTSQGGTTIKGWTDNSTNTSITATGLTLKTSEVYYVNVRAHDNAGNITTRSSDGQLVAPSLSFSISPTILTFDNLNAGNSYTDTETTLLDTSTNAYGGYVVRLAATDYLRSGSFTIPDFSGGTYALPDSWQSGDTGFGYTSSDTDIQGVNKFQSGICPGGSVLGAPGCYAPYSQTKPGDIVADHTSNITGAPIVNEQFTITHRTTVLPSQAAAPYSAVLMYAITAVY